MNVPDSTAGRGDVPLLPPPVAFGASAKAAVPSTRATKSPRAARGERKSCVMRVLIGCIVAPSSCVGRSPGVPGLLRGTLCNVAAQSVQAAVHGVVDTRL